MGRASSGDTRGKQGKEWALLRNGGGSVPDDPRESPFRELRGRRMTLLEESSTVLLRGTRAGPRLGSITGSVPAPSGTGPRRPCSPDRAARSRRRRARTARPSRRRRRARCAGRARGLARDRRPGDRLRRRGRPGRRVPPPPGGTRAGGGSFEGRDARLQVRRGHGEPLMESKECARPGERPVTRSLPRRAPPRRPRPPTTRLRPRAGARCGRAGSRPPRRTARTCGTSARASPRPPS